MDKKIERESHLSDRLYKQEIHTFNIGGRILALDVRSLKLFRIDRVVNDILEIDEILDRNKILNWLRNKYPQREILNTVEELLKLGVLTKQKREKNKVSEDIPQLRGLALHVSHKCNMRCKYCYGDGGNYGGDRILMNREVSYNAIDFLIKESGETKHCFISFFGGEPLLNFELIKDTVSYAKKQARKYGKKFHFGITTNGTLLTNEIIEYVNRNKIGVMVSIDGPKAIHDSSRRFSNGQGTYDVLLPKVKKLLKTKTRGVKVRATITHQGVHIKNSFKHFLEIGFKAAHFTPVFQ